MPRLRLLALFALGVAAGCGGGNGDDSPPHPPPPAAITTAEAYRFLNQATFGATPADAEALVALGYEAWIDRQLQLPASLELPHVEAVFASYPVGADITNLHQDRVDIWLRNARYGPDQLRQRVAFALSEIMVISELSPLVSYPWASASYYDMLALNAFGNFRRLMEDVTLHPAMGVYLSMLGNQKPDTGRNIRPDENYAREHMQLFTIGLVELNADGSVKRDMRDLPIPTYNQAVIEGFAHVYTGWHFAGAPNFDAAFPTIRNQVQPMEAYPEQHDGGAKRLLDYPGAALTELPAGQSPQRDLEGALDNIYNHPNVAPFIARQLIQRLVTSNPSPEYVERVARTFDDDGSGKRGELGAVIKAILLDREARSVPAADTDGKLDEPLLRLTRVWRAFGAHAESGRLNVQYVPAIIGQGPLQAPSVFNFFSPFHAPFGEIIDRGLVAPEMQMATEYLSSLITNYFFVLAFCFNTAPVTGCPAVPPEIARDVVVIDTSDERAIAGDAGRLVEHIGEKLLGRAPSPALAAEARAMVENVPAAEESLRVAEALYLIAASPEFALQP